MTEAQRGRVARKRVWAKWRPWRVCIVLFAMLGLFGYATGQLYASTDHVSEAPGISELGYWAFPLGFGHALVFFAMLSMVLRGTGTTYCESGLPGLTTWSAGAISTMSLLLISFVGMSLGTWTWMSFADASAWNGSFGSRMDDLAVGGLYAIGAWVAASVFVPLRRRIQRLLVRTTT